MRKRQAARGADALCRGLADAGITHVFGLPGTQNVALYEALRRSRLRSVLATHELAATFMANGYYRASGRPAAVFTIPGPGFAYALPGLAEAFDDSAALVHVVGQAARGPGFPFQALDQHALASPLVKGILFIDEASRAADRASAAVALACAGEPGPVLLECSAQAMAGPAAQSDHCPAPPRDDPAGPAEQIAMLLSESRRSLLLAGQGTAGAADLLRRLAEALGAPVLTTSSGRGTLAEDHPLAMGMDFSRQRGAYLPELIAESDCILALGCKLGAAGAGNGALRFPPERLIRVDSSPRVLDADHPARLQVVADAAELLALLVPAVETTCGGRPPQWPRASIAAWRARLSECGNGPEAVFHGLSPPRAQTFFAALRRALPRDGILVTDSGTHQDLARRYFEVLAPRGLVHPADFQSMGFGLPAAIGACLAEPKRQVVALIGDGGMAMSAMELLTAVRERLRLPIVVLNDGYLGRIRLQQLATYGRTESVDLLNPDFAALAAALGAGYARVEGDPEETLRWAFRAQRPTLVEVRVGDSLAHHASRIAGRGKAALRGGMVDRLRRRVSQPRP